MRDVDRRLALDAAVELTHFAFRAMTARPDALLEKRGLSRVHHRILHFVVRLPAPSVSQLLRTLGISKQALNGPLRDLYAQKLITYARAPDDARVKHLSLTPEGRKLEGRLSALQRAQFAQAFAAEGAAAEAAWRAVMRRLAGGEIRKAGYRLPDGRSWVGSNDI
ncbi:MAG: MarR family transcriptional regulator [Burkholderiales bacterium]|nr:MarR family transcriptional regulator [Burkholderiales bacterium]